MPRSAYGRILGWTHRASMTATQEIAMSEQFPAHLAAAIKDRIAVLRQAWDDDSVGNSRPRVQGYPAARPHSRNPEHFP